MPYTLFIINNLAIGGAEKVFVDQLNYLQSRDRCVALLTLFPSPSTSLEERLSPKVKRLTLPWRGLFNRKFYLSLSELVRRDQISAVYATLDQANIVARWLKHFCPELRVVIRESGSPRRKTWKLKLIDLLLNHWADSIVAVSNDVRRELLCYQPFYRRKVVIIENGIEDPVADDDYLFTTRRGHQELRILNVGSMKNGNKSQDRLIRIWAKIVGETPNLKAKLILVGEGHFRSSFMRLAQELKIADRVIFLGLLDPERLKTEYLQADIFALYSKTEGFPNAGLEAAVYGLPVVASAVGGLKRLVVNGETGLLVRPGDDEALSRALWRLLSDPTWRERLGRAGRERVKKLFSFQRTIRAVEAILQVDQNEF